MSDYRISSEDKERIKLRRASEKKELEAMIHSQKFNDDSRRTILRGIQLGLPKREACWYAGITEDTLNRWLGKGQMAESEDDPYYQFMIDVRQTGARWQVDMIRNVDCENNPKLSLELLKLRRPDVYSVKQSVDVNNNIQATVDLEDKKDRLRRLLKDNDEE